MEEEIQKEVQTFEVITSAKRHEIKAKTVIRTGTYGEGATFKDENGKMVAMFTSYISIVRI